MRLSKYSERKKPQLMIIPMIDIIFFLLVFFMISMLSMVHQQSMAVNLPQASAQEQVTDKNITVTITKDGELYFNKEVMDVNLLAKRLELEQKTGAKFAVIVNGDKDARHEQVVKVLDIIRNAGITRLAIATQTE
ncbi:MAG: biopolymer transporter ExbD [Sporomusaceae bacterium]|jgi:biopolymer transport protein ExbD|nr:biopolymer transporter ExbD [Sporomusaceae bacterium]